MSTLVFLHGWGMNRRVFDDLVADLAPRHSALALDLPGYGEAAACEPYALDRVAAAVAARAPGRCVVAGWSLGALVALAWARAAPQQVERLSLLAATPCFVQREDWKAAVDKRVFDRFVEEFRREPAAMLGRFVALQAHGDADAKRVTRALRAASTAQAMPCAQALEGGLNILAGTDWRARLPEVEQPALVIHGENDPLVPLAAARFLSGALPCARLAVVPGAAHAPFVSEPRQVVRALVEFFDER